MSTTAEGAGGHWGVCTSPGGENGGTPTRCDWSYAPGFTIDLNNLSQYSGHNNTGAQFYSSHYQINWYIKRRMITS